ncbi:nitroreductase family protein [Akkermansiaceae bacterium]|nr:nitroreductase family protein [Akkermansiaceae bacterium]MDB4313362.1 nitroreductase family protein [bacterium]MDA7538515.1 nitroreductase family protein [Akkermansiaceae bacterium]MDA7684277.1 nitroreductase family protein [Akkermansiaceae bacterium]MDA7862352.1 nitroreductase family protein [Akkermansiaceae bacterium]
MSEHVPLNFQRVPAEEMTQRAEDLLELMKKRRSVRDFSTDPIPDGVIERCLEIGGRAPSGANQQPWHFAVVRNQEVKRKIREAAEAEEREFYESRAPQEWLDALDHLGTDARKPFLETAPALIAIFQKSKVLDETGEEVKVYYPKESLGIATGFLISALHQAGLATLTHTPSPMKFLNEILERPSGEKPFLLLVVGYPAEGCQVPAIEKLALDEISSEH